MYRCLCGAVFAQPLVHTETDRHEDGFSQTMNYLLCPSCGLGDPYFEEVEDDDDEFGPIGGADL